MSLSRSEQMLAEKTMCILLLRGNNAADEKIWAYVAVRADKLEEFMKAQDADEIFYPEDYGVEIESGIGEPSDEVKERMTKEYGFNHEAMVDIPDVAKASKMTDDLVIAARPEEE